MNVHQIALDKILPPKIQPRLDPNDARLKELAASIKRHGLLSPLTVTTDGDNYRLLAGNRRLHALHTLGKTHADCNVIHPTDFDPGEITLVENLIRLDLSPVEEAYAFALHINNTEETQDELAQRLGQERTYVTRRLMLLDLDDHTLGALQESIISLSQALLLRRIEDPTVRERFIEHAQTYGANVRTMQYWVANYEKEQARAAAAGDDAQPDVAFTAPRQTFMACDKCGTPTAYDLLRPQYCCPDCRMQLLADRALQEAQK